MWELDYMVEQGEIEAELAALVKGLITAADERVANRYFLLLESRVAPVHGGIGEEVESVVRALVRCLPAMGSVARNSTVELLFYIAGSLELFVRDGVGSDARSILIESLPMISGLVESGDLAGKLAFTDLLACCASFDPSAKHRVAFYLSRLVPEVPGAAAELAALGGE
jgi:hypothetical protein